MSEGIPIEFFNWGNLEEDIKRLQDALAEFSNLKARFEKDLSDTNALLDSLKSRGVSETDERLHQLEELKNGFEIRLDQISVDIEGTLKDVEHLTVGLEELKLKARNLLEKTEGPIN